MQNNKKIKIAVGKSRLSTYWPTQEVNWSEFVDRIKTPIRFGETLSAYLKMPKSKQDELKDVGGFVGGELKDNKRKKLNVLNRYLISLDADNIAPGEKDTVLRAVEGLGCAYVLYSTRKHEEYAPRLRIVLPLDEPCTADEYEPISRRLAELIGISVFDPTTFDCARLMYWPSASQDSDFVFRCGDKPFVSRSGLLGSYANWQDCSSWPIVPGQDSHMQRMVRKQEDPLTKEGAIGAFCKTYTIQDCIDKFLADVYEPCDSIQGRYTYIGASTVGGAVVYDDKFLYSHHATDPCSMKLCNAFDLVRTHLFSQEDDFAKEGTPTGKLPSYAKAMEFAMSDEEVADIVKKEKLGVALNEFSKKIGAEETLEENDLEWTAKLEYSSKGTMLKTADNMKIIMLNDPNLKGCIAHNEFSNLPTLRKSPPWRKIDSPERWREIDDAGLRMYIEKIYGLTGREKINDAFVTTAYASGFDEVKSYLLELPKWDGVERLDTLLIDYLGTDDNKYYRQISRKTLTAAVKRVFEPGCKFDNIMVLSGSQGFGKSTFISKLGQKWFSDNIHEFAGKEASGQLQGYWLLEVGELAGLNKSDVETAKAFISRSVDIYRAPYEKRTVEFPRRCILIGSTNSKSFLRDKSGGRRYWPVEIKEDKAKKSIFTELEGEVEQIWAEALMRYRTGEKVYITEPDVKLLEKYMQSAYTEDNSKEGIIEEFVSRRVPADWSTRGISARRIYWNSEFNADGNEEGLVIRKRVCISEIWCEAFGGDLKDCKRAESNEITQIMENLKGWRKDKNVYKINKDYGSQRTFIREDAE